MSTTTTTEVVEFQLQIRVPRTHLVESALEIADAMIKIRNQCAGGLLTYKIVEDAE